MKRKMLAVLIVCTLALLSVSAATHSILAQVSPYSYQDVKFNNTDQFKSKYGFGAKLGYRYQISSIKGAVGLDVSFTDYKYSETTKPYFVISALIKAGVIIPISNVVKFDFDFGAGIDVRSLNSVTRVYPAYGIYAGFSFAVSSAVDITAGADFRIGRQRNTNATFNSLDTALLCNLGARINL